MCPLQSLLLYTYKGCMAFISKHMRMDKKKSLVLISLLSQKSIYPLKSHSCLDLDTLCQLVAEFLTIYVSSKIEIIVKSKAEFKIFHKGHGRQERAVIQMLRHPRSKTICDSRKQYKIKHLDLLSRSRWDSLTVKIGDHEDR